MGISPMGSSMVPAVAGAREQVARECGELVMQVLADDLRPSQIITKDSLENAIATVACRAAPPTASSTCSPSPTRRGSS